MDLHQLQRSQQQLFKCQTQRCRFLSFFSRSSIFRNVYNKVNFFMFRFSHQINYNRLTFRLRIRDPGGLRPFIDILGLLARSSIRRRKSWATNTQVTLIQITISVGTGTIIVWWLGYAWADSFWGALLQIFVHRSTGCCMQVFTVFYIIGHILYSKQVTATTVMRHLPAIQKTRISLNEWYAK